MSVPATDIDGGELKRLPTRPRRPVALVVAVAGLGGGSGGRLSGWSVVEMPGCDPNARDGAVKAAVGA